jgi:hypothetical protein
MLGGSLAAQPEHETISVRRIETLLLGITSLPREYNRHIGCSTRCGPGVHHLIEIAGQLEQ